MLDVYINVYVVLEVASVVSADVIKEIRCTAERVGTAALSCRIL